MKTGLVMSNWPTSSIHHGFQMSDALTDLDLESRFVALCQLGSWLLIAVAVANIDILRWRCRLVERLQVLLSSKHGPFP